MNLVKYIRAISTTCAFIYCVVVSISAQRFEVVVSKDTILAGNVVNLTFVVEDLEGDFVPPDMSAYSVISGPNVSSHVSVINGVVTRRGNYNYVFIIKEEGEVVIPSASFITDRSTYETKPTTIMVLPNPEGIIEQSPAASGKLEFNLPGTPRAATPPITKKRKKRKLRKI